jgi:protoporphyrinogen/coproporphyrinogen III oxidase
VKRVAIIGGGLAGLSCAFALKRRGIESTVFEASSAAGGRDGAGLFLLAPDLFQNTFQLIRDLGLSGDILPIEPNAGQVYKGRVYRHRVASATGLLKFRGLNFTDKALLARMAYLLARLGSQIDFHRPERGLALDDETVASFIKRELSQNILNYVAGPLISTLFFYGSDETSRLLYLILAKHMSNTSMSTLRGGFGRLTSALAEQVRVDNKRRVGSVAAADDHYALDGERFSDVVFAIPGDSVLGVEGVSDLLSDEDREFFRTCQYQRVVTVLVETERPVDGGCYAVSIPRVENLTAATISFYDYIDPSRVPQGRGLLAISGGGPNVGPEMLLQDLQRLYPISPQPSSTVERNSGMPKFPPGRYRQIDAFQKRHRRPGLFFCGDYLSGPFVEGAITTGLAAGSRF